MSEWDLLGNGLTALARGGLNCIHFIRRGVGLLGLSHLWCSDQHVVTPSISLLLHPRSCHIVHLRSQRRLARQGCRILNIECLSCRALHAFL
jgi:hypothetical protein